MHKKYQNYLNRTMAIAAPCITENIMASLVSFIDTFMVGSLGAAATAAVAINAPVTWFLNGLSLTLSVGGMAVIARHIGAGEKSRANEVTTQTLGTALIAGAIITIAMLFLSPYIPMIIGAEPDVLPDAQKYLKTFGSTLIFHLAGLVAAGLLRGAGNTKTPMAILIFSQVFHVSLNFLLIFPGRTVKVLFWTFNIWGADLGVFGAALSTAVSQGLAGILIILCLFLKWQVVRADYRKMFKIKWTTMRSVLKIGVPASVDRLIVNVGQLIYQGMIASLGTVQVAAHYLAVTAESIAYMPAFGFSVAATALVGQSLGAGEKDDALAYGRINIAFGLMVGLLCAAIFVFAPHPLLGLFIKDRAVIDEGAKALRIMGIAEPFACVCSVFIGVLRGAGDTKVPMYASLIGMFFVRLTLSALFVFVFDLGLAGAWMGMAADNTLRAVIIGIRYLRKKWLELKLS